MRKLTTYKRLSIADQIKAGKGTTEEVLSVIAKLEKDGALTSTIKKCTKALAERIEKFPLV